MSRTTRTHAFMCAGYSADDRITVAEADRLLREDPDSLIGDFGRPFRDRDLGDLLCPRGQPVQIRQIPARYAAVLIDTGIVIKPTETSVLRDGSIWPACLMVDTTRDATIARILPGDLPAVQVDYVLAIRDPGPAYFGHLTIEERAFLSRGETFADRAAQRSVLRSYPGQIDPVPEDRRVIDPCKRTLKVDSVRLKKDVLGLPVPAGSLPIGGPAVIDDLPYVIRPIGITRPDAEDGTPIAAVRLCDRDGIRWPIIWIDASMICRTILDAPVPRAVAPTGDLRDPAAPPMPGSLSAAHDRPPAPRGAIRPRPALPDKRYRSIVYLFGPIGWYSLSVDDQRIGYAILIGPGTDPDKFDHGSWDRPLTYSDAEGIFRRLQKQEEVPNWIADPPVEEDRRAETLNPEQT